MNPSRPTRKVAPASTVLGAAKGGTVSKPQRDSNTSDGKSHYVRKASGLSPTNISIMKQREGSAITSSGKVDSISSGPIQPYGRKASQSLSQLKKGVD